MSEQTPPSIMKMTELQIIDAYRSWSKDKIVNGYTAFDGYKVGLRAMESRLLPLVEAQEWLLIDTPEKKKAMAPIQKGDEWYAPEAGMWFKCTPGLAKPHDEFSKDAIFRRPISWHEVSATPIPKGVPVWLWLESMGHPMWISKWDAGWTENVPTHWRYAQIPAPPQIDKERQEFEKWKKESGAGDFRTNLDERGEQEWLWLSYQAGRRAK